MAKPTDDLDFSHNVQQVPAGESLPKPIQQKEHVETQGVPDIQGAVSNYAEATNWMSSIGSAVATKTSNQLATQLGDEQGKNPHGDLGIPLTEFDKVMQDSYKAQAHATLSLQANKLITDANIELASAPRISPDMIANKNKQVAIGLESIYKNAPAEIRPGLQQQFGGELITQNAHLTNRMIGEQRQDEKERVTASTNKATENLYNLGMAGHNDLAEKNYEQIKRNNDKAFKAGTINETTRDLFNETAYKTLKSAQYSAEALKKQKEGKLEPYLRKFADETQPDLTPTQKITVTHNMLSTIQQNNNLRMQDQQLQLARFNTAAITNPGGVTDAMIQELKENVTPLQFEQANLALVKALNKDHANLQKVAALTSSFGDASTWTSYTDKEHTESFGNQVQAYIKNAVSKGLPITQEQAEAEVALTAGGPIKSYETKLSNMLQSADPAKINAATAAIDLISNHDRAENIRDISDKDLAMSKIFSKLKQIRPTEIEALQEAHQIVYGKSKEQREANDEAYANYVADNRKRGESVNDEIMRLTDVPKDSSYNVPLLSDDVKQTFKAFFSISNGDSQIAIDMTKEAINRKYGISYFNGRKEFVPYPVARTLGLPDNANGVIHNNLAEQVTKQFAKTKEMYDAGKSDFYWEVEPSITTEQAKMARIEVDKFRETENQHPLLVKTLNLNMQRKERNKHLEILNKFNYGEPPTAIQVFRDGHRNKYPLSIEPNKNIAQADGKVVGGWYVNLKTPTGTWPVSLTDPMAGNISFIPDKEKATKDYMAINGLSSHEIEANNYKAILGAIAYEKLMGPKNVAIKAASAGYNKAKDIIHGK